MAAPGPRSLAPPVEREEESARVVLLLTARQPDGDRDLIAGAERRHGNERGAPLPAHGTSAGGPLRGGCAVDHAGAREPARAVPRPQARAVLPREAGQRCTVNSRPSGRRQEPGPATAGHRARRGVRAGGRDDALHSCPAPVAPARPQLPDGGLPAQVRARALLPFGGAQVVPDGVQGAAGPHGPGQPPSAELPLGGQSAAQRPRTEGSLVDEGAGQSTPQPIVDQVRGEANGVALAAQAARRPPAPEPAPGAPDCRADGQQVL